MIARIRYRRYEIRFRRKTPGRLPQPREILNPRIFFSTIYREPNATVQMSEHSKCPNIPDVRTCHPSKSPPNKAWERERAGLFSLHAAAPMGAVPGTGNEKNARAFLSHALFGGICSVGMFGHLVYSDIWYVRTSGRLHSVLDKWLRKKF